MNNIGDANKEILIEGGLIFLAAGYSCCFDASLGGSLVLAGVSAVAFGVLKGVRFSCLDSCTKTLLEKVDQEEGALDRTQWLRRMPAYVAFWSIAIAASGLFTYCIVPEQSLYAEEVFRLGMLLGFSRYTIGALYNWAMPNQVQEVEQFNQIQITPPPEDGQVTEATTTESQWLMTRNRKQISRSSWRNRINRRNKLARSKSLGLDGLPGSWT